MTLTFRDFDKNSSDDESGSEISDDEVLSEGMAADDFSEESIDEDNNDEIDHTCNEGLEDEEDEVVKAIKSEKNKTRDHPPTICSEEFVVDISFNPSKNIIAIANIVGDVLLYEYTNEDNKLLHTLELHVKACRDVEFDSSGLELYSASKDLSVTISDIHTAKLKRCIENAHEQPIYSLKCLDNNKFVTGDDEGTVKLWDVRKPDPVFSIKMSEDYVADMITNDSGKYLACAGGDGILTTLDLKGSKIYTRSEEYDAELTCLGLFRTNTKLLVGSSKGKLYLFNWKEFGLHSDEYIGHKHSISCMVPITENIVVTSGEDGILRAAHMFPQRQLGVVGQHRLPVERLDISHDGQFIASCSHDNDVKFWNISYFESIDNLINVTEKQNKKRDMRNNLPSSSVKNASDFFSGLA